MTNKGSINKQASLAKSLFFGKILEENLLPFPTFSSSEQETLTMVLDSVDKFMEGKSEEFRAYDKKGEQPEEYLNALKELGLFGLIIPEEHGGIGFSNAAYSRVLQQTSRYDASTSLTIGAHSSIGMKGLLLFGTPEQKKKYLPKLASGETIAAFCLTEPGSGSDAASIKTTAVKNPDGTWTLNGDKLWITNGPIAGFFSVFAKTEGAHGKMTGFIVESGYPGVSHGPKEDKMGIRASATSTVTFQNVKVPAENVLGGEGQGFKVAMAILNNGRTGLGGGCVGAMKRIINAAVKQATERKQFGKSIAEFSLVKEKIAQMTVLCFAAESVVNMVAWYIDSGNEDYSVEAAMSKIFATEALWNVAYEGLQIAGGNGFMKEYPYEIVVRDSRINLIFEGTNEILRLYVALSALKEVGENIKGVMKSATKLFEDPIKGFGVLKTFASKKVGELTKLGGDKFEGVHPALASQAAVLEQFTQRLGKASDEVVMKYKAKVIGEQLMSRRLADIGIDLFVGYSILSRITSMLKEKSVKECAHEIEIAEIFTQQAKRRMNSNIRGLLSNEDKEIGSLSDAVVKEGKYKWDLL